MNKIFSSSYPTQALYTSLCNSKNGMVHCIIPNGNATKFPWLTISIVEDQSLDMTTNLPTTPVLVSQLVGGHEALLSGNQ